jgi:hypothetical protein
LSGYQSTNFLPEIKSDPCVLAVDSKVHVKQVESHHCLPWAEGVVHNVKLPDERVEQDGLIVVGVGRSELVVW